MKKQKEIRQRGCVIGVNDSSLKELFCCFHCEKDILPGEKFVFIGDYVLNNIHKTKKPTLVHSLSVDVIKEQAIHYSCWREILENMVKARLQRAQEQAVSMLNSNPLFKQIKSMLPNAIPVV